MICLTSFGALMSVCNCLCKDVRNNALFSSWFCKQFEINENKVFCALLTSLKMN